RGDLPVARSWHSDCVQASPWATILEKRSEANIAMAFLVPTHKGTADRMDGGSPKDRGTKSRQEGALDHLRHAVEHAAHLLPAQGPITVFIHHNPLHAFEDLPFDEAVVVGGRMFGCQPYLSEDHYREELAKGRIRFSELRAVVRQDLGRDADPLVAHL